MRCVTPAVAGLLLLHMQAAKVPIAGAERIRQHSLTRAVTVLTGIPFVLRGTAFGGRCTC